MRKIFVPLLLVPLFLVGCKKNKDVYASSKNTMYSFELDGKDAVITGFNDNYKNQSSIIIPYSIDKHVVKKIADNAFYDQYRLKNIDLSKTKVTEIGENSFNKCVALENISFTDTIETIKKGAFSECTNLKTIDMANLTVTNISDEMFKKCTSLTNVTLPKECQIVGSNVFANCDNLATLDLSDTKIVTLEKEAFASLKSLSKVTFPNTLKEIKEKCFSEDKKIQFIDLSKTSVESIGNRAFYKCEIMENINVPETLNEIGLEAFSGSTKLKKIDLSKTSVKEIKESTFELCVGLTTVSLPKVTKISDRAFYNSGIIKIYIPETVTSISDDAFRLCNSLKAFEISDNNTSYIVRDDALYTSNLEKLIQYPALKEDKTFTCFQETKIINSYAFAYAINLEKVDLSPALYLNVIDDFTFLNCESLKEIKIEDHLQYSIQKIGVKAFNGCKSLTEFDGLSSVKEIGDSAFYDCTSLKTVELKNAPIVSIGSQAFFNCSNLERLTLNSTLKTMGRQSFYGCNSLETIIYTGSKSSLDTLFVNSPNSGLENYYNIIIHS